MVSVTFGTYIVTVANDNTKPLLNLDVECRNVTCNIGFLICSITFTHVKNLSSLSTSDV